MNRKPQPRLVQHKTPTFTPAITTIAFLMLIGRRKHADAAPQEKNAEQPKPKTKALMVAKYEVTESAVKFFDAKGFPKKRWVLVGEIPVAEIGKVESFSNELSVTWNGVEYRFAPRKKGESLGGLCDRIQKLLEEKTQIPQNQDALNLAKGDLAAAIGSSVGVVDLLFNVLMGLNGKRVDWVQMDAYLGKVDGGLRFGGQTFPSLKVDFGNLSGAVNTQDERATAQEIYKILKATYQYFDNLKAPEDLKESSATVKNAKSAILAYYTLNDLIFGKLVGDKDLEKEFLALEAVLKDLDAKAHVKVGFEELKAAVDKVGGGDDGAVEGVRAVFREQLKLL